MKQNLSPRVGLNDPDLQRTLRDNARQINALSEGSITANYNAATTAPTTGDHAQGDVIRNSTPTELGTGGSKYVVKEFICVLGGTPGTWVECRYLTGN